MSTIVRPAGPQPARVYWVRRAMVLAVLLLLVIGVWSLTRGGGGGAAAADDEPVAGVDADAEAEAAAEGEATGTDSDTAARTCGAGDLTLVVTSDAASYPAGSTPTFTVRITNTSDSSCTVDAGEATRELLVTSGSDRIWSSLDCPAADVAERVILLKAGGSDDPVGVAWPRVRSDETCGAGLPEPRPGTYKVVAKLVGAESQPATFTLG